MSTIERNGKIVKVPLSRTDPRHVQASAAPRPLPPELIQAAEAEAPRRGMLAGDLIAAMTAAIGVPTCGGCERRQQWLNAAHRWLRGE